MFFTGDCTIIVLNDSLSKLSKNKIEVITLNPIAKKATAGVQIGFEFGNQVPSGYIGITIIPYSVSNSSWIKQMFLFANLSVAVISNTDTDITVGGFMLVKKS